MSLGVVVVACLSSCGSGDDRTSGPPDVRTAASAPYRALERTAPPVDEAAAEADGDSYVRKQTRRNRRRYGSRADFRIPRDAVPKKGEFGKDFALLEAVIDRPTLEIEDPDDARWRPVAPALRTLTFLWTIDGEIGNGGFSQYYFNSTAELGASFVEGADRIGAGRYARLVRRADAILTGSPDDPVPLDRDERQNLLDRVPEGAFDRIDDAWYALNEELPVDRLGARYIRAHPKEFFAP